MVLNWLSGPWPASSLLLSKNAAATYGGLHRQKHLFRLLMRLLLLLLLVLRLGLLVLLVALAAAAAAANAKKALPSFSG